jgi:hypothetical protein
MQAIFHEFTDLYWKICVSKIPKSFCLTYDVFSNHRGRQQQKEKALFGESTYVANLTQNTIMRT